MTSLTHRRWAGVRLRLLGVLPLLILGSQLAVPAQATAPLAGVDVSKYQHPHGMLIDWGAVKRSGQVFAFIKASGGSDLADPWFAREWAAAGKAGMIRGAYHYANPRRSADGQAAFVVETVGSTREAGDLGIVLDLEDNGGLAPAALSRWAHAFLTGVEKRTGRVPILYTYPNFWHTRMKDDRTFGAYPLWLARYSSKAPAPLPGWNRWTFWQSTSSAHVRGIPGAVDHDQMCCGAGTLAALADGRSVAISRAWRALGGASGQLGLPLGPESPLPGGWSQVFEKGYVTTSKQGTWSVLGPVYERYKQDSGVLGLPQEDQRNLGQDLALQAFSGGTIVWSKATGAFAVRGDVLERWLADGGPTSPEGLPVAEATEHVQQFVGGGLYRTDTGVRLVPGPIRDRYEELGGATSSLGLPLRDAYPLLGGTAVDFQNGQLLMLTVAGQTVVV